MKSLFILLLISLNIYTAKAQQPVGKNEAADIHFYNFKAVTMTDAWKKFLLPDSSYDQQGTDLDVADWKYAGIHWAKVSFLPGMSLEAFDQQVNIVSNAGLRIIAGYKKPYNTYTYGTVEEEALNVEYLKKLVRRYKDRIKYWQIWNEVNLPDYWKYESREGEGGDDPNSPFNVAVHKYVLFLKDSYDAIKSVDPEAKVVLSGLNSTKFIDFMDRLNVEEAYKYFDEAAFHPYAYTPEEAVKAFVAFQEKVGEFPAPYNRKPIWITEIGWHAKSGWTSLGTMYAGTEQKKGDYLAATFSALVDTMSIKRPIFWYCMHENNDGKGFGLTQKIKQNDLFISNRLAALESMKNVDDSKVLLDKTEIPNYDITISGVGSGIKVYVDDNQVVFPSQTPIEYNGKIMLPIKPVFSAMNLVFDDSNEGRITAKSEIFTFSFGVGKMIVKINGDYNYLDQFIYKINNSVMLPIELIKKAFAANVIYNATNKTVSITTFENYQKSLARIAPTGFSFNGSWSESSLLGANPALKTYFSSDVSAYAIWNPGITAASNVKIFVYKLANSNSSKQTYCIFHNGVMDVRTVDFKEGLSGWVELGTFYFSGSGIEYLKLTYTSGYLRIAEAKFEVEGGGTTIVEQTMLPNLGNDDNEPTEMLLSCNFENLLDENKWLMEKGQAWEKVVVAGNNLFKIPTGAGENLLLAKNIQFADGYAESDIIMHSSVGGAASGLLIRYTDQNNYYMVRLHSTEKELQLFVKQNGTFTKLKEIPVSVNLETTYRLKIKTSGSTLKCYLNGELKIETVDDTFTNGSTGFRVYDQSVSIDNVEIHKIIP